MNAAPQQIKDFNAGRDAQLLTLKYDRMYESTYRFFRATSHLFYADFAQHFNHSLDPTQIWGCGDLHLQNFGTYKAENRLVYFDLNDFDDGLLLPATWELARMLVSIYVAAEDMGLSKSECNNLVAAFLKQYTQTLQMGKPIDIDARAAKGMLKVFMVRLQSLKRKAFIKNRTVKTGEQRLLIVDHKKILPLSESKKRVLEKWLQEWPQQHPNPFFSNVRDMGVRVTGTASLGLERYVILAESPKQKNYLFDLKETRHSTLAAYVKTPQPVWATEAERVIEIQRRVNNVLPTLLSAVMIENQSFTLRELQPEADKFDFQFWNGNFADLEELIGIMANITASGHLRSAGRQGSSIADELIAFGQQASWQQALLDYCAYYPNKIRQDYLAFCEAIDDGFFDD
jgi:uncharacterized protein (DUF2252 family)